jgi:hypothetical protein
MLQVMIVNRRQHRIDQDSYGGGGGVFEQLLMINGSRIGTKAKVSRALYGLKKKEI